MQELKVWKSGRLLIKVSSGRNRASNDPIRKIERDLVRELLFWSKSGYVSSGYVVYSNLKQALNKVDLYFIHAEKHNLKVKEIPLKLCALVADKKRH